MDNVFTTIGEIVSLTLIATGFAYFLLKTFSKKFIENEFSKQLEVHKQKLNAEFNRMTIVHQKEIEILPQAWAKLQTAVDHLSILTSLLESYPDFKNLTKEEVKIRIENTSFMNKKERKTILSLNSYKQTDYYQKVHFEFKANKAWNSLVELHLYIQENSIFLVSSIKDTFMEINQEIKKTINKKVSANRFENHDKSYEAFEKLEKEILPLSNKLDELIKNRLHVEKTE